jgi:DNA segregation ATPase FtsK/SpoIIIE, S-DNA-T family
VATKQKSRGSSRSTAKRPTSGRGKAKAPARPAGPRNRGGGSSTRGATKLTREPVVGDAVRQVFAGHGHDVWGLVLILVGIVTGLGLYGDLAGPLGDALATGAGAAVGKASYLVPPALVVLGALLIRGPRTDEDGVRDIAGMARPIIGAVIVLLAGIGLLGLTGGSPGFDAPLDDLIAAGGYVGAVLAVPLESVLSVWGAALVFVVIAIVGVVVLTDTHIRTVAGRSADGVRPAGTFVGRAWRSLFELGADPDDEYEDDLDEIGYDADLEPEPKATRARKPKLIDLSLDDDEEPTQRIDLATPTVFVAGEDDSPSETDEGPTIHLPEADDEPAVAEQMAIDLGPAARKSPWKLPPAKLLSRSEAQEVDAKEVEELGHTLERALAAHGVETRLVGMVVGPTVTRYELELGPGVKVARVTSLHKDIAYAMASPDVRILAPIPGRQAIGVEVPNVKRQVVAVGDILSSEEARKATHPLEVAIGRDINGRAVLANLSQMPHILIAGATGAGKSSCINSLITSILMRSTPDQVRLILVDPKRVELGQYNRLPHLLTQVVTSPKKAANALNWAVKEMERRYDLLAEVGFRDINGYNAAFDRGELNVEPEPGEVAVEYQRLPYILIVVDELNDLMMVAARDVEESICRIAQMARAVGIHLVIATQRPSVNVITGVIKANVPARLAFAVSSLADSRVILDQPGAERLVGKGDMLLLGPSSSIAQRIQGAWVTEKEVHSVVGAWLRQAPETHYLEGVEGTDDDAGSSAGGSVGGSGSDAGDDEDLLNQAMELIVRSQLGSTSMLQRKLRVGFARAGRLMDLLEQRGVVGPSEGSKARAVLMTPEELDGGASGDAILAQVDDELPAELSEL